MNIDAIINASGRSRSWALDFSFKTEKEAIEAVKEDGYALQYVREQSEAICLEAVKESGDALQYVDFSKEDNFSERK